MRLPTNIFLFSESDFTNGANCRPLSNDVYRKELESILHDEKLLKDMDSYIGMMQFSRIWYASGCMLGSVPVPEQFSMFENANWLPVIYCFRHALEVAFKAYLLCYKKYKVKRSEHNLKILYEWGIDKLFTDYFDLCCGKRGSENDIHQFIICFSNMDNGEDAYRYYMDGTNILMRCNMDILYVQRIIDHILQIIEVYVLFDIFIHHHNVFPSLCFLRTNMYGVEFYQLLNQGFYYRQSDEFNKCTFQILFGCDSESINIRYNKGGEYCQVNDPSIAR